MLLLLRFILLWSNPDLSNIDFLGLDLDLELLEDLWVKVRLTLLLLLVSIELWWLLFSV